MGFIKSNNPLNPKFDILLSTFTYKSNMKTLSTPSSGARYLETIIFRRLILSGKFNLLKGMYTFFQLQVVIPRIKH